MVDGQRIAEWLSKLVQIPSVGPENSGPRAGVPGEAKLAAALADWFKEAGAETVTEVITPGRPNTYGIWRNGSSRWVALDVHTDTVSVETMPGDPFDGRIADNRVYGRGSVDTKASLAVALTVIEAARKAGKQLNANVIVAATMGEETGAGGAEGFARWVREQGITLEQLMVAEPTMCAPIYGHKGGAGIEFEIHGVAAHSSTPELGQNAISAAARLILAFDEEAQRLANGPASSEMGAPRLSVTVINGGLARNIIPDLVKLAVSRRMVPGEDPAVVAEGLLAFAKQHCPLPITMNYRGGFGAFYQPPNTAWIEELSEWSGMAPTTAPYGTNMFAYLNLAKEAVVLGPGSIERAHRDVEWVDIPELEKAAGIYERWWGLTD